MSQDMCGKIHSQSTCNPEQNHDLDSQFVRQQIRPHLHFNVENLLYRETSSYFAQTRTTNVALFDVPVYTCTWLYDFSKRYSHQNSIKQDHMRNFILN